MSIQEYAGDIIESKDSKWFIVLNHIFIKIINSHEFKIDLDVKSTLTYFETSKYTDNGKEVTGHFRTNQFRLEVFSQEGGYTEFSSRPPDPSSGYIMLCVVGMTVKKAVPYALAKKLQDLGSGKDSD